MVNLSAYPVTVDGRRLDDLAIGLEASALTLGALRSADQPLAGLDGEVASTTDSREPGAFALTCLVKGTDADGLVPITLDGQALYQRNLETLKHLLCKTGTLLDVRRVTDRANSAILGTGGRTNLVQNPSFRATAGSAEIRRNLMANPSIRTVIAGTYEVRRNYIVDPRFVTASGWSGIGAGGVPTATQFYGPNASAAPGETWTVSIELTAPAGSALTGSLQVGGTTGSAFGTNARGTTNFNIPAGTTQRVSNTFTLQAGADGVRLLANLSVTAGVKADRALMAKEAAALPYFDGGGSGDADGLTYAWTGTVNNSASTATGSRPASTTGNGNGYKYVTTDGRTWYTTASGTYNYISATGAAGKFYAALLTVKGDPGRQFGIASTDNVTGPWCETPTPITIPASGEITLSLKSTNAAAGPGLNVGISGSNSHGLLISKVVVEEVYATGTAVRGDYFDGSTAAADGLTYAWTGTVDNSASTATGALPDGWIWSGAATASLWVDTSNGWDGPGSVRAIRKVTGPFNLATPLIGGVNPGDKVAVSFYYKGTAAGGAILHFRDASGVIVAQPSVVAPAAGAFGRSSLVATAPPTTTSIILNLYTAPGGPGDTYAWDAVLIEKNGQVLAYFDGDSAGAGWLGAPQISQSYLDSADLRASCKVVDSITPEDAPGDYGRLTAVLKVVHAYWRGATYLTWWRQAIVSSQWMQVTSLEGSSAPIGDAVYCLTGPAASGVQIMDVATGTYVRLNEALPAGSVWRVNADTWESRVAAGLTVDSPDTAGTDKAGVTDQSGTYPRLLRLHPRDDGSGTGRRIVQVAVVGTGFTSATSLAIKARGAHL